MNIINAEDTIAAAATPPGIGALGVVRVSGKNTLAVLSGVFLPAKKQWTPRRMYYGHIHYNGLLRDEVMCCYFAGPRSYTGEDMAEIYTHGGSAAMRGVTDALYKNGARPAQPGEFTKRAFINGRIDLSQAEAVMELIAAKSEAAAGAGLRKLGGGLSGHIERYRGTILSWLAHIELSVDYPEHGGEAKNLNEIITECAELIEGLESLAGTAEAGRVMTEGARTAIVGRPNAGKSSLLNAMLAEDRAIVTELPGTTRDVLSEYINVRGVLLLLSDTAGLRDASDVIEKLGVEKSVQQAGDAELLLYVVDRSEPPSPADAEWLARFGGQRAVIVFNKCDLEPAAGWADISAGEIFFNIKTAGAVSVSAKTGEGLDALYNIIEKLFFTGLEARARETDIITRERHRFLLERALEHLNEAVRAAKSGVPEDLISFGLRAAYEALGEILGKAVGDDVTDRIFSEFCVGK